MDIWSATVIYAVYIYLGIIVILKIRISLSIKHIFKYVFGPVVLPLKQSWTSTSSQNVFG